jgi:hypothetical protein
VGEQGNGIHSAALNRVLAVLIVEEKRYISYLRGKGLNEKKDRKQS